METTSQPEQKQTTLETGEGARDRAWNDGLDGTFFQITASLFPGPFTYGASVLLGSYDGPA